MTPSKKFALLSLVVIFISGVSAWFLVRDAVREQALTQHMLETKSALWVVSHDLGRADFEPGATRLSSREFDMIMKENKPVQEFAVMNIWSTNGTILYSDDSSIIGKRIKMDHDMLEAARGEIVYEEAPAGEAPHGLKEAALEDVPFLEIYSPIEFDGEVVGMFETYSDLSPLHARTAQLNMRIVAFLCVTLASLWLILAGVVRQATSTIDRQNVDLHDLNDKQSRALTNLEDNYLGSLQSLATAVEARDPYTSGHSQRTRSLSLLVGRELGLTEEQLSTLGAAATLHDIGKIGTPEAVLGKSSALTSDEWHQMKQHPVVGAQLVSAVPFLSHLAAIVRSHHENYDGTGYPDGLKGEQISIEARILAVTDAFDAITSKRPHRMGASIEDALVRVCESRGTRFDPVISDLLKRFFSDDSLRLEIESLYGVGQKPPRLVSVD